MSYSKSFSIYDRMSPNNTFKISTKAFQDAKWHAFGPNRQPNDLFYL